MGCDEDVTVAVGAVRTLGKDETAIAERSGGACDDDDAFGGR